MVSVARGIRWLRRKDIVQGAALSVLVLLAWRLLRCTGATARSEISSATNASHQRRIAEHRPEGLTGLVSNSRPARFLSVHLPGSTPKARATEHDGEVIGVQPHDLAGIWEYLLGKADSSNIGWPLELPGVRDANPEHSQGGSHATEGSPGEVRGPSSMNTQAAGHGMAQPPAVLALPDTFDWQTYLMYYPDLRLENITSEASAQEHYLRYGRAEHRVYRRVRVLLRYTACTGLMNQHYSHIAAFTLAAVVNAELVLPPAVQRDSFAHYFSQQKEQNEVQWTPAPLEWLLDVDYIIGHWAGRGMIVHKASASLS